MLIYIVTANNRSIDIDISTDDEEISETFQEMGKIDIKKYNRFEINIEPPNSIFQHQLMVELIGSSGILGRNSNNIKEMLKVFIYHDFKILKWLCSVFHRS